MTTLATSLQPRGPGHILWPVIGCQGGPYAEVVEQLQLAYLTLPVGFRELPAITQPCSGPCWG